jgi:hypothetical protein
MTNVTTQDIEKAEGMDVKDYADPFYDGCPCDFHSKKLTNEETRMALFHPMKDGSMPSALVMIERFWHMQDAHYRALDRLRAEERSRVWKKALEAVPEKTGCGSPYNDYQSRCGTASLCENCEQQNIVREKLIETALSEGVIIE